MDLRDKIINAEQKSSKWLADGNYWDECGCVDKAEKCYEKAQYWLDRLNKLLVNN